MMDEMFSRHPLAMAYGGIVLYKRSQDGRKWDDGIITKFISAKSEFFEAKELFVSQASGFYLDLTNPDRLQHAYRVKLVGLGVRAKLYYAGKSISYQESPEGPIPGIVTLSREERWRKWREN